MGSFVSRGYAAKICSLIEARRRAEFITPIWLTLIVQLPVPDRVSIRRIQDRLLEEAIIHV
jgi:hypothetical protein